jgi:oligopeptide transport system substrate-binding protein
MAIDRKSITEDVLKGGQIPATGFIPGVLLDSQGNSFRTGEEEYGIDPNGAKVEEAQELLAEAGYPDGEGFPTLEIIYNTDEGHQKVAEAVQEMLKANLNINVELVNEEWAVFQDTRHSGDFEIARGGWLGDYADPMTMLDLWTSYSGNNDAQWRYNEQPYVAPNDKKLNPEQEKFDQLIQESMVAEGVERDELLKEADKYLVEDNAVVIPLYYYSYNYCIDLDKVEGVTMTSMGQWIFKDAQMID